MNTATILTRDALLDAAENLFSTRGYASVGIREIADAAGANVASIKYYFGSKKELYLEAVRRVMTRGDGESAWSELAPVPTEPADAADKLLRFLRVFLRHLIPPGSTVETCSSLMVREALMPSEALDAIVNDFLKPNNAMLVDVIRCLAPTASEEAQLQFAGCILGQVLHVRVFRPFVERLRGVELSSEAPLDQIALSIGEFSLRGLGLSEEFINDAITRACQDEPAILEAGS